MTLICFDYFSAHIFMAIWFTLTVTVTSSLVTFSGIVMLFNDSHKNKAPFPMLGTLSGIIMLSNKTHHLKASHPTLVTLFGIVMLFNDIQYIKSKITYACYAIRNDIRCIFFPFRIFNKYAFGLVEQYTSTR